MFRRFQTFFNAAVGRRLTLGIGGVIVALLALSTAYFVQAERREMEDILVEKGKTAVHTMRLDIARALQPYDRAAIEAQLQPVLEDRDFEYAYVFTDDGVVAAVSDVGRLPGPRDPPPALTTLHASHPVVRSVDQYMELLTPVVVGGQTVAGLGLGLSLDLLSRQSRRIQRSLSLLTLGLVAGVLAFAYWWARRMVAPLIALTHSAERFSDGDLTARVPVRSVDEIGRLAGAFNHLADSLARTLQEKDHALHEIQRLYRNLKVARAQLGQAERLSAVGILAAGVSHELNNPLGIILSTAGNLREALCGTSACAEDLQIIEAETQRCRRIIQGLLNFAASGEPQVEKTDLNALVRETFALAVRDDRAQGLQAEWALDPTLPPVWVDPHRMRQVFLNLLVNAADAMGGRGVVRLCTAPALVGDRPGISLEVTDQGCGIDPGDLDRIFDPFYTTKKGGAGYGLGLAVSYGIVAAHGGELTVTSQRGRGSVFTVTLPLRPETASDAPATLEM
jgi:signal transduction histidine kinase